MNDIARGTFLFPFDHNDIYFPCHQKCMSFIIKEWKKLLSNTNLVYLKYLKSVKTYEERNLQTTNSRQSQRKQNQHTTPISNLTKKQQTTKWL